MYICITSSNPLYSYHAQAYTHIVIYLYRIQWAVPILEAIPVLRGAATVGLA